MNDIRRNAIRKHLEAVLRTQLCRLKEAIGDTILNEDANWLTHKAWMELGAVDARMTAEVLNCHVALVEAIRAETLAKSQLSKASANASKAFQTAAVTLSQLTTKFLEKREDVKSKCALSGNKQTHPFTTVQQHGTNDAPLKSDKPSMESQKSARFDAFDVESVMARAPELRSQMGRQLIAEARNCGFTSKQNGSFLNVPEEVAVYRHCGQAESHPTRRLHGSDEERAARARMKVSLDGSLTEEHDVTEHDCETPWPRPPNFDDEEPSSFISTNRARSCAFFGDREQGDDFSPPITSHHRAPPRQHSHEENWMVLPKPPALRSKAVQDYLSTGTGNPNLINEFSCREFDTLHESVQALLTREQLNEAVRILNAARSNDITVMAIHQILDATYSTQQCRAVYRALVDTGRVRP